MKKKILSICIASSLFSFAGLASPASSSTALNKTPLCKVEICNKLERFSLNPFTHMKDSMGEICHTTIIDKSEAKVGKVLNSESRWYQGSSINPTKKSVTKITKIIQCD